VVRARSAGVSLLAIAALAWPRPASGHQGYPDVVKRTLGVDLTVIDPPTGCQLCHTSSAGGSALRPFGTRLVSTYGLDPSTSAENDSSLVTALQGLEKGDVQLAQDLKAGTDPNVDVPNDPTPQYGCSVAPDRSCASSPLAGIALAALAVCGVMRARRRRLR
jgi:hypothetical protein